MAETWIDKQTSSLRYWLSTIQVPLEVTLPDGDILWCNQAFEEEFGYTLHEIERDKISWHRLTVNIEDTQADVAMCEQLIEGKRRGFTLNKEYRTKDGRIVPINIHVQRYPADGEFEFFLVSAVPSTQMQSALLEEMISMKEMIAKSGKGGWFESYKQWFKDDPRTAWITTAFVAAMVFGDRFYQFYRTVFGKG